MAISLFSRRKIRMEELFDGRLEHHGVYEAGSGTNISGNRYLTDGRNCLLINGNEFVEEITKFGLNAPGQIIRAIQETFDTVLYSEYRPIYEWDCDTDDEFETWEEDQENAFTNAVREEILHYTKGSSVSSFGLDVLNANWAFVAEQLIAGDPQLVDPFKAVDLAGAVREIMSTVDYVRAFAARDDDSIRQVVAREVDAYFRRTASSDWPMPRTEGLLVS